eukprot:CAMPEP_0170226738 /NCGR_PEP_ID=MMETSP0116_2-20130129/13081_1 /TAXON_ID=400756 /ORGANISM="Durinskia baltica, Strain CSIRO CS-38" /LENGTH=254 /DNA_ID=CAMNT_0010477465 /DNA_START=32 /DNA_END=796 /DNA_ORIENTATION=+
MTACGAADSQPVGSVGRPATAKFQTMQVQARGCQSIPPSSADTWSTDDALSSHHEEDFLSDAFERLHMDSDGDVLDGMAARELREALESEAEIAQRLGRIGQQGLVAALANVLTHLVSLGQRPQRATVFHAARPPQISILDYVTRIATYFRCSDGCLILGLIYIDRLVKGNPGFVVSGLNVHRLVSVGMTLAAKYQDDVFYSNAYYAKVAGLQTKEFNRLEEKFLQMLEWRVFVLPSEYEEYFSRVMLSTGRMG